MVGGNPSQPYPCVAVLLLVGRRPVRPHAGVNRPAVQIGWISLGVRLVERHAATLRSGKLSPEGDSR